MTRLQALQARVAELEELVRGCRCRDKMDVDGKGLAGSEVLFLSDTDGCAGEPAKQVREPPVVSKKLGNAGAKAPRVNVPPMGSWRCIGGSRFWRPNAPSVAPATADKGKDDGFWVMEGNSKIWRRKSESKEQEWVTAKSKAKRVDKRATFQLELSNRFSALESDDSVEGVRILVVGDSRVRPLKDTFCYKKDRCVVRPGARVADLEKEVDEEIRKCSPKVVIVQVGVNDVGRRCSEKTLGAYHSLLQRLQEARKPVVVTGILPRRWATTEWYSRAIGLNSRVSMMCMDKGLQFVDAWDIFYGNNRLYSSDGLHLSHEGARALGSVYHQAIQGNY